MTDPNPTVILGFDGTVVNVRPSPMVADFSSRGPSLVTPQILKPDVIAPGVSILAAWSEAVSPSQLEEDKRITKFNIISGTSMACPHASGIVALLKAAYPTWSPSAIKSAIMTSAYSVDNTNSPIRDLAKGASSNPWAYGSGHVDPKKALSPGLVYDISKEDYAKFFCSLVLFKNKTTIQYSRELTNVGPVNSVYKVTVTAPSTVQVTVKPAKMVFKKVGEKQRYTATFKDNKSRKAAVGAAFGWIVWSNAQYKVGSSWKTYSQCQENRPETFRLMPCPVTNIGSLVSQFMLDKDREVNQRLVYHKGSNSSSNFCLDGTLEPALSPSGDLRYRDNPKCSYRPGSGKAGGVGMILMNSTAVKELVTDAYFAPTVAVGKKAGDLIKNYVRIDPNPTVRP
ncbi:hypothetical protein GH714_000978 [Hevea brasiliensis]|uniref:Subtilisin-like protease fibronectin type-III domain-containing protein n=1 Tax=Hevea brasiliensis TaxID=3981 RepID=A0A6A6MAB5_HEVBR|nr:hypothetical protein GH714_000978 [Hevea brasiliensis]